MEIRTFFGHASDVTSVAFRPDGMQILSGSKDNTMKLWDKETGKEIRTFTGPGQKIYRSHTLAGGKSIQMISYDNNVLSVAFNFSGNLVLSGHRSGAIILWDAVTGREIRTFSGHTGGVNSVAFSPDGKKILSGSSDETVKLWDIETGNVIRTISGHTSGNFRPDGEQILSSSTDGTIKLWNAVMDRELRTFNGYRPTFSSDGKQILFNNSNNVKLFDAITGEEIRSYPRGISVVLSPDGKQFISGNSPMKLWDIDTGRELLTFGESLTKSIQSVCYSPDGKQVLFIYEGTLKLWDAVAGREISTITGHTRFGSAAFSPDGKQIISGHNDNTLKLWDTATGREIRTFSGSRINRGSVISIVFSPDGMQIISGSSDESISLWDTATGKEIKIFRGHVDYVTSVAFSQDGNHIISGSSDDTVKLWNIATGRAIRTINMPKSFRTDVALSPDRNYILSYAQIGESINYDNTMKLWDMATVNEIRSFNGHKNNVNSAIFSPDGKQILSGSMDGTVKLWDTATGREIRTFRGHTNSVTSVGFSPDGKQILSGSHDGTTRLWDIATGKEIASFISFSGSDTQVASATRGLTVETETAASSNEGEWLSITPDGYYQASPRGDRYLNVRVNNTVSGIDSYRSIFYNPDVVQARLNGRPDPASKAKVSIQQAANFLPPTVTIQSPTNFSVTDTATANLSVAITDQNQPIKNIKILVNGRLVGRDELSSISGTSGLQAERASLTVTGNQKTVNLSLPLNLDPGNNRIEVVAFNGYSDTRRHVDVTWNAPAGQRPALPNLWILAVGVNKYNDTNINSLNFCVADAKGVIASLKEQEGRRYAKVNSLIIADGEELAPNAVNIRQNLKFLDQAGERDVVLLFLAGHGVSDNAGKFLFLPNDTRMNKDKTVVEASAITDSDIVKVLDRAGNLLVFIDACQSGGVDNDRLVRSLMDTNAFVFTSSRGNELSQERKELGHGVFTYSIMNGLRGAPAAQAQGNVTVVSLSGFVSQDVPRITGGAQNPKAYSLGFYDFPMAVIK
jgi:WD40 repeat protein